MTVHSSMCHADSEGLSGVFVRSCTGEEGFQELNLMCD